MMNDKVDMKDYTILVVDDDDYITELVQLYLKNKGFYVISASNGKEALKAMEEKEIHLLILDIMLPNINGWKVCETVRKKSDIPILMLTAKGESEDKLRGFLLGTDDYMVKPFDPNELVARVVSLLRRSYTLPQLVKPTAKIQFGTLEVDTIAYVVTINNELVDVTPREYQLLLTFARHPNQVLERQQLLDLVWGEDYIGEDRVVDVFVQRLRHKLSDEAATWKIETVRGIGYKFRVEM
jgi:DNA-binding response OmpR family regulator